MINFEERRRLIPLHRRNLPIRWIMIGAGIIIFLSIYLFFKSVNIF